MPKTPIRVLLDPAFVEQIDDCVDEHYENRSQLIREALRNHLQALEGEQQ